MTMLPSQFFVFLFLACGDAKRIDTGSQQGIGTEEQNNFGHSCETLHSRFGSRTRNLQMFLDSHTNPDGDMTVVGRGRAVMKTAAVLRTLRRSSDCAWVTTGNTEDIEAIGQAARTILANNPCAPAALADLQRLEKNGEGDDPLGRAMAILMSDSCEIESVLEHPVESNNIVADIDSVEIEERLQDGVEEMLESEDTTSSLMEKSDTHVAFSWAYLGKLIGALMLGILFVLSCAYAGAMLGTYVGLFFAALLGYVVTTRTGVQMLTVNGLQVVGVVGITATLGTAASCAHKFAVTAAVFLPGKNTTGVNASGAMLDQ